MATLALPEDLWDELGSALAEPAREAGVLLAGPAADEQDLTLLGRAMHWIPEDGYLVREPDRLEIASSAYVPLLKAAAEDGAAAIFFHTHPGGTPAPSVFDLEVDEGLRTTAQVRSGSEVYASLILAGSGEFSGRAYRGAEEQPIERLRVVGPRLRVLGTDGGGPTGERFERQIRAFGAEGQRTLSRMHVGVVGAGGTGSTVFELLARLGVGRITTVDDDLISESNLTRIHESGAADVGRAKVEVAAAAAARIGSEARVTASQGRITSLEQARLLRHCDLIFGCTDDNGGRAVLSRLAYWYLIPVIDCAFLVDSDGEGVRGLFGRVTTFYPGEACLVCRGRIDMAEVAAEALPAAERERLAGEGYVPGLGEPDPSVGAYTTLVAAQAVTEMLDRLFGFSGGARTPSEVLLRLHERQINAFDRRPREGHYCAERPLWGRGDEEPMLGQLWAGSATG